MKLHPVILVVLLLLSAVSPVQAVDYARYGSALTLASGPHNTAFAANIGGLSYNPAGISAVPSSQALLSYAVTPEELTVLGAGFVSPLPKITGFSGFLDFSFSFSKTVRIIEPRAGIGWSRHWFHTGAFCGLALSDPMEETIERILKPAAGILLTPGPARIGATASYEEAAIRTRLQTGVVLLKDRIRLSAGASRLWKEGTSFVGNAGIETILWDFLSLTTAWEGREFSAGFSLNAYATLMAFSFLRDENGGFHYALSFNIQQ